MASGIVKSLQLTRVLNRKLFFNTSKLYFNSRYIIRPFKHPRNEIKYYSTAAHNLVRSDESLKKTDLFSNNSESVNLIDDSLSRIDYMIRRSGRIQMKHIKSALSMITSKDMTTSTHGLYLLRSCKYCYSEPPAKRIELVNEIWNRYQELGIQFEVLHYNALLEVHINNGATINPVEILNSMEDSSIEPNKVTYMLVMKKYCQDGNINGASEILEHMKEKGIPANEDVFNNLILGHVKNNDFSGAKDIIDVMRSSNLKPSADTYGVLACGCAASGNMNEMMSYLKQINDEKMVENYLNVIDALLSSGNHQHVDSVLSLIKYPERYQQEFINSAIELIHKGFVDTAYKLIISSYTPDYDQGLNIFIKQLIKTGKPVSEIIHFCTRIYDGYSKMIFSLVSRSLAEYGRFDCIVPIFKKQNELGHHIRSSYFYPLFTILKDEKSHEGIWLILKHMSELGVPADFTTYYEVIYPILKELNPTDIIRNVESTGQTKQIAAEALFLYYCDQGEIDYIHQLIGMNQVYVSEKLNVEHFVNLYSNLDRRSEDKYLEILKYIFMEENHILEFNDVRGKLLAELISRKPRLLEILVRKYEDLTFNQETQHMCASILHQKKLFNRECRMKLDRLRDIAAEREFVNKKNLSLKEENEILKYLEAKDISCKMFLAKRINHHMKTKNLDRISQLLSIYDQLNFPYSPLLLSNLIGLYCTASDIEKTAETFSKLRTEAPGFKLDIGRTLEYVTLLVKYEKFDESIEVLKTVTAPYIYSNKDYVMKSIRNLGNAISISGNAEFAKTMQNMLLPLSNEFRDKGKFLESVVQLHLQKKDLTAAYEEFKNCVRNHRIPVSLNLFLKKCIDFKDKNMLQKVIDLAISCVGESYTLLELSIAFIENHDYEKAIAVIKSLNESAYPSDVENLCMRLKDQNKLSELEHFIKLTRPLNHDNREDLYCHAIRAYAIKQDIKKVTELRKQLEKEMGGPSQKAINLIHELLQKNKKPIPVTVSSKDSSNDSSVPNLLSFESIKTFMKHLEARNVQEALKELSLMKKGYVRTLSMKTLIDLVDLCLQEDYMSDLSCNVNGMSYILDNARDVLKPILEKYSAAGDVEKFATISFFFPDFSLINIGYNRYFCQAFIASGKQEELLSKLEERTDKKNKLFSPVAFEELLKYPEYEDRVFDLAVKYYDSSYFAPMAVVWAQYFSRENFEKADKIFKNFDIKLDKIDNAIISTIRNNENVDLAQNYVNVIKSLNVRNRIKERAFGAALDVLVLKGMYDEAVALVLESEKLNLQLNKYYLSTLVTLKDILEKENKPVPFRVELGGLSESSLDSEQHS